MNNESSNGKAKVDHFIQGDLVTADFTFRPNDNHPRKPVTVAFDFSKVSREELLALALDICKQKWAGLARSMADLDGNVDLDSIREIDVKLSLIDVGRKAKDTPEARQAKALDALLKAGATSEVIEAFKASMRK